MGEQQILETFLRTWLSDATHERWQRPGRIGKVKAKRGKKGRREMQPLLWHPPMELSEQEEWIMERIRRAHLFVFLRRHRHELLDEAFQQELAGLYRPSKRGQPPIAPAQLALTTIMQEV